MIYLFTFICTYTNYELPTSLNIFDEKYNLNDVHARKVFIEEFIFNISLQKLV